MYERLAEVELKDGERVEAGRVEGPDADWAERVEALLGHKGPLRQWQNAEVVRGDLGLEARFYILHRGGEPFANIMTVAYAGVGYLGHVWTRPEDRRKGACDRLMGLQMEDFRRGGGRALFLGTGYDSPPYHIYAAHGFASIEDESGSMAYGADADFYDRYFAAGPAQVEALDWPHWPASAPLFLGPFPGAVRSAGLGLFGRASTEGRLLPLMRDEGGRRDAGESARARVLVHGETGAVLGLASWGWDPLWPETALVDLYCHPGWWGRGAELLESLELPSAERHIAYADGPNEIRDAALRGRGFAPVGICKRRVAADRARRALVDVAVWER